MAVAIIIQVAVKAHAAPIIKAPQGIAKGNAFVQSFAAAPGSSMYDPFGRVVRIVETRSGSVVSTKQFVWAGNQLCEERDGSGSVTRRFFSQGEQIGGTNYFYTRDHLDSVREMTDASGAIAAQYNYDPYGQENKMSGAQDASMQYAGMYVHAPSGLNLAVHRAYSPRLARWLSRDPVSEQNETSSIKILNLIGTNPFAYVLNRPIQLRDPLGLVPPRCPVPCGELSYTCRCFNACGNDPMSQEPGYGPQSFWICVANCMNLPMTRPQQYWPDPYPPQKKDTDGPEPLDEYRKDKQKHSK